MIQKPHNSKTLPKIKSYKNDLAPICFYFDLFTTPDFQIPVMPLPMRVDKVSNGESTYLILPNFEILSELCDKLNLQVNFKLVELRGSLFTICLPDLFIIFYDKLVIRFI